MQYLIYLAISLIISISFFIGAYISKESKEELDAGIKYFNVLVYLLALLILFLSLYGFYNLYISIIISTVLIGLSVFLPKRISYIMTLVFVIISFYLLKTSTGHIVFSLMFSYGLVYGSIIYKISKNSLIRNLLYNALPFLLFAAVLYFI